MSKEGYLHLRWNTRPKMLLDVEFVDSRDLVSEAEGVYGGGGLYVVAEVDVRGAVRECEGGKYVPSWAASMASMGEAGIVVENEVEKTWRFGVVLKTV
jgi:hypothetical protein